ncbi:MAG: ATP-binding protein [Bacteroidales bacterium]|nr:ATP-binding protein [Bacteroidales bacterium]MDD4670212.1 ATP-binding protein [Bacteroidales bacterium]
MNDLAMHILDIVQNSISAGAKWIEITVIEDIIRDILSIIIKDNGKGMSPEAVKKVTDPYFTSRTTRKVGLGIPLLKQTAIQTGGDVTIESQLGVGTTVRADFGYSNIDRPPLGDLANAYILLLSANPDLNMVLNYSCNENTYSISTDEIKEALDDVPLNDPSVVKLLNDMVRSNILDIQSLADN